MKVKNYTREASSLHWMDIIKQSRGVIWSSLFFLFSSSRNTTLASNSTTTSRIYSTIADMLSANIGLQSVTVTSLIFARILASAYFGPATGAVGTIAEIGI